MCRFTHFSLYLDYIKISTRSYKSGQGVVQFMLQLFYMTTSLNTEGMLMITFEEQGQSNHLKPRTLSVIYTFYIYCSRFLHELFFPAPINRPRLPHSLRRDYSGFQSDLQEVT
jgi:hypothetical protein